MISENGRYGEFQDMGLDLDPYPTRVHGANKLEPVGLEEVYAWLAFDNYIDDRIFGGCSGGENSTTRVRWMPRLRDTKVMQSVEKCHCSVRMREEMKRKRQ